MSFCRLLLLTLLASYGLVFSQEAVREPLNVFGPEEIEPEAEVNDGVPEGLIRQKLKSIFISNLSLEAVPLDITVDLLMSRSIELDTLESNPRKKGVCIIIRPEWDAVDEQSPPPEISTEGENISLEEAISLIAKAAKKRWRVSNGAVVIGDQGQIWGPRIRDILSPQMTKTLSEWKTIILPSVSFTNTPISEVIEIIHQKCAEFDPDPPTNPIELCLHVSTENLKSANHRINLKASNISAFDVLVHTLAHAGYNLEVGEDVFLVDDLWTLSYALEWDHWLWMMRIGKRDPDFTPRNFDPNDRKIRVFERKTARKIYEACGVKVAKGESFIYGPATTLMIARLGGNNRERVKMIHKTMSDWKAGRTDQWHLDWMPE